MIFSVLFVNVVFLIKIATNYEDEQKNHLVFFNYLAP